VTVTDFNFNTGSITEGERRFVETWESVSEAMNWVIREDRRGDEQYIPVTGSMQFKITTYERILTQDKIKSRDLDPFLNGQFRPVIVPESISVVTNPNALSDDDIRRIFVASDVAWDEYMAVIDAPATLRRMIQLAEQSDLSLKRYRELEAKESATNAPQRVTQASQEQFDKMGPTGTPTGSAPPNSAPPKLVRRTGGNAGAGGPGQSSS
jgi:polyphosphate kinase